MPANEQDVNFFGAWPRSISNSDPNLEMCQSRLPPSTPRSSPRTTPSNSAHNSPVTYPSSPVSTSPVSMSPLTSLRRNYSSTFMLIPEDKEVNIVRTGSKTAETSTRPTKLTVKERIIRIILWWPLLLLSIAIKVTCLTLRIIFAPLSFATPTFWLSALLWVFWKAIRIPVSLINWILEGGSHSMPKTERNRRTILISCGSTIQTLHLARNFYSSGARVVVFEFEGLFGLARFSTAVSKFYTVPMPSKESPEDYISALCDIVEKEKANYYIPVCATSPSLYDSMAKPHLELLGCSTFIPGMQENRVLDDSLEMIKQCRLNGISLPAFRVLSSKEDLCRLYEIEWLGPYRNIVMAVGQHGIVEHHKYILPKSQRELKILHEISDDKQWLVVKDLPGNHYITCTTIKESRVIANVTCLVDQETKNLVPEENQEIESWLNEFFSKVRLQRPINGHISFRFVKCDATGHLLPLGSRVGVSLPYICHTGVHSRVLCKPCPHFSRANSGPIIQKSGLYWIHDAVLSTLKHPSVDAFGKLIGTVLDKREVLFAYWDPLPYCAYYHFQLPFNSVKKFLRKRQTSKSMATTLTAPVH